MKLTVNHPSITNSINTYEKGLKLFDLIYTDTITNSEITEHGIRYMLEQLDPHSTYIPANIAQVQPGSL